MIFESILSVCKFILMAGVILNMLYHLLFDTMAGFAHFYYTRNRSFFGTGHGLTESKRAAGFFSPVIKKRKIVPFKNSLLIYGGLPGIIHRTETLR